MKINELLKYVQKTNPDMTKEKLIEELGNCNYSSVGLVMVWKNNEKACKSQA